MDSHAKALLVEEAATAIEREVRRRLGLLERENDRLRGEVRQARLELDRPGLMLQRASGMHAHVRADGTGVVAHRHRRYKTLHHHEALMPALPLFVSSEPDKDDDDAGSNGDNDADDVGTSAVATAPAPAS